jgi:hypothetical protein
VRKIVNTGKYVFWVWTKQVAKAETGLSSTPLGMALCDYVWAEDFSELQK